MNVALEQKRQDKTITGNLSARVHLTASGEVAAQLEAVQAELPTVFGVSQVELQRAGDGDLQVDVLKADGTKCERCWRYVPQVSDRPETAGLCDRCVDALAEPVSL